MIDILQILAWWVLICAISAGLIMLNMQEVVSQYDQVEVFKAIWWDMATFTKEPWAIFGDILWGRTVFHEFAS